MIKRSLILKTTVSPISVPTLVPCLTTQKNNKAPISFDLSEADKVCTSHFQTTKFTNLNKSVRFMRNAFVLKGWTGSGVAFTHSARQRGKARGEAGGGLGGMEADGAGTPTGRRGGADTQ